MVQVLDGENLHGGTPLVEQLLLLTGMEGCVTQGELVGVSFLMGVIPHSLNSGVTRLPVCKAGCSGTGSIDLNLQNTPEGMNSDVFLSLASHSNSK